MHPVSDWEMFHCYFTILFELFFFFLECIINKGVKKNLLAVFIAVLRWPQMQVLCSNIRKIIKDV